jgi:hypothetical protein
VLGSRGSGSPRAAPASWRVLLLRAPPSSFSFSPLSFSSGLRVCGQGIESPKAARVGRALGVAAVASYSDGQRGGTWTVGMRRMVAGRVATAAMTGTAALWRRSSAKAVKRKVTTVTSR